MPSRLRSYLFVPLCIAGCSIAAGVFATVVEAASIGNDAVSQSLKSFTSVYTVVEKNFADPVNADTAIYKGAIPGMLHQLDPHSTFFDPKAFAALREDQSGHYYGIGMTVTAHNGKTVVVAPFAGSPAYKAGIRPGDVIFAVGDKQVQGLSTSDVADLLKGPKGTSVQVTMVRDGSAKPVIFHITRAEIPHLSVPDAFFVKPGIAYLKIDQFNEDTGQEMENKLKKLGENNIKGLILDLRENPGGLLNEAVRVAGHFLRKGEVVVSHRGLHQPNKTYTSKGGTMAAQNYPIVVVVNRLTASAAEIVSGALQDHDRGWILGETTFGKGLVQTVFPLSDNTGLALTTAHYYTPSGRLIQRDYSHMSFLDYYNHANLNLRNNKDVKMTDSGRTVYGGGGITPDQKYTAPKYNKFQMEVRRKYAFYDFSAKFFGSRPNTKLPQGWSPDAAVLSEFREFLTDDKVSFTDADFSANRDWMKQELKREMYITAFGIDASRRVSIEQDPEIQQAVQALPKAQALIDHVSKQLVERLQNPAQAQ